MRISTSSWHYRFNSWIHRRQIGGTWVPPRSLCPYFWGTVGHLALFALAYVFAPIGFIAMVMVMLWLLGLTVFAFILDWWMALQVTLLFLFGIATLISTSITLKLVKDGLVDWFHRRVRIIPKAPKPVREEVSRPPRAPREPSLLWAYLKAAKQRMCPIIEYVTDTEA